MQDNTQKVGFLEESNGVKSFSRMQLLLLTIVAFLYTFGYGIAVLVKFMENVKVTTDGSFHIFWILWMIAFLGKGAFKVIEAFVTRAPVPSEKNDKE